MFGVSNTSSGVSGSFGTTPKTDTNSLFKPSFGTTGFNSTASPSSFFGNFQNTTPVNNSFSGSTTNFGTPQHSSSTNLFGSQQQQQPLNLFGAPQQSNSSFFNQSLFSTPSLASTTPSKLFTNSVQQPSNVSLFNTGTSNSNLFGTGTFGASSSITNSRVGTKGIQYREEQDATAQAKICCITFLPEINQQKCLEELRYEDYIAGNHTNLNVLNQTTSQPLFSSQNLLSSTTTPFNTTTAPPSTTSGILTGQSTVNTSSNFNNQSNTFFGGFSKDNSKPSTGLFGSTSNSIFSSSNPTQSVFGSKPTTSLFGTTVQPNTSSNVLTNTSLFGTTAPTFGAPVTSAQQGTPSGTINQGTSSLFQNVTPLAQPSSSSLFGTPNTTTTNLFTTAAPQTSLFGSTSVKEPTQSSTLFGSNTTGVSSGTNSLFNTSTSKVTPSLFGTTNTQPQLGKSLFDTSTTAGTTNLFTNTSAIPNSDKLGGTNLFKGLSGSSQNTFGFTDFSGQNKTQAGQGLFNETKTSLFSPPPTTSLFSQGNLNTTNGLAQSTISSNQKSNENMACNNVSSVLFNNSDPYGINRVTPLLETRYLTRGQLPSVPKPFSFPACGVILPSQYRRNKLNASTQFWQPISDNASQFKKFSSTPQRFTSSAGRYTNFMSPLLLNNKREWDSFNDKNDTNFIKSGCRQDASLLNSSGKLVQSNKCLSRCNSVFRFPLSQYTTSLSPSQLTSCQNVTYRDDAFTEARPSASTQCFEKQEKMHQRLHRTVFQEPGVSTPFKKNLPSQNEGCIEGTAFSLSEHYDACQQKSDSLQNNPSITRRTGRITNLLGEKTFKKHYNRNSFLKCTREGYSTRPSLETLQSYSDTRLAAVEDFTICHEMYGEITWPGLTDIRGISIDDDVIIEDRAVEVYPFKEEPPVPIGEGLNKPALVTLYNCGPKTPQENLTSDQLAHQYQEHVEKIRWFTKKMQAQFIALTPDYVWKFRVEHFSRYGLFDEEVEEEKEDKEQEEQTTIFPALLQESTLKDSSQSPLLFTPQKSLSSCDKKETFSEHLNNFSNMLDLNKTNFCTKTLQVEAFFVDNFVLSTSPNIIFFVPQQISITKDFHSVDDSLFCLSNTRYDFSSLFSTETYSFETLYFYYVDSLLVLTFQLLFDKNYQLDKIFALQVQLIEQFIRAIEHRHVPSNIRRFLVYSLETWQLVYLLFGDLNHNDKRASMQQRKESSPTASSPEMEVFPEETNDSDFYRELYKHRITLLSEWFSSVNTPKVDKAVANLPVFSSHEINLKTGLLKEAECRLQKTLYYMMSNNIKQATTELMGNRAKEQIPFFRLALCLTGSGSPSLFGVPSNREPLFQQLIEWQKRQIYETIPLPVLRIHHVLAGCIDRLIAKEALDWKTLFALLLWYPSIDASLYLKNYDVQNDASSTLYSTNTIKSTSTFEEGTVLKTTVLQRAFHTFTHSLLNLPNQNTTPAPLPEYLGLHRRNVCDSDPIDLQYQLLRFFCYNEINYTKLFHLSSVCGDARGIILLWPLFQTLKFFSAKTGSEPSAQLYYYLDTLLYQYLQSLKLYKWCVLLIFSQVSRKIISKKKALQNILTLLYYGVPILFQETPNLSDTNCYTNFLNFLQHPDICIPFHFLLYVSLAKLPFAKKGIESSNLWLNCALASLQVPCETKSSDEETTVSFFETLFHHRIPTDVCPSPTSLFCHGLVDLLLAKTFYSTIEKLCVIIQGHSVFTWNFLFLQKASQNNFYVNQKRLIFSKILKKVEVLFNQATCYPNTISFCNQELNIRTLHEFCQLILSKFSLFLLQTEWEKCVLMPLCTFVTWIVDVLIFFSHKDFSDDSKVSSSTKKKTNNSSSSLYFDDSMSRFCDVAQHMHDIAGNLLKFSGSSSDALISFSESNQPLLFIPPSQQKHSRLPYILTSLNRYSTQAFQLLEAVYTCLNTILKGRSKSLSLKGDALDLMNNPQDLSDYGYGVLLAC
ncbi:nuclear pore complex protein Nup98-Nup96-like isoform X2 [Hylaeus volcanicus]|uniref:nuclear pore complex protein Nup98-Nup96-like isoform X2 n=1 Tax=Hylaeus volcanicus TaxID=313075 RepID=UPI0023B81F9E|nr:nuclear pore complex protein Nup98-Nup96-like isoform X2 [Hylaeus volcanicus]